MTTTHVWVALFLTKKYTKFGMQWRLIDSGRTGAFYNMALDEAIFTLFPTTKQPVLRFYQWSPPALSIGYFQKISRINVENCKKRGYHLVRRPTGGRAVLHNNELTYSFVQSTQGMPESISESYKEISHSLVSGLKKLGLPAKLCRTKSKGNTPACFDSPARYEIEIAGKKVMGSAQTRKKGVLLQQGSIPITVDVNKLLDLFKLNKKDLRKKVNQVLKNKAAGLADFDNKVEIDDLKQAIKSGFEDRYEIKLRDSSLGKEELKLADKLTEEKYSLDEWNYRR